MADNKENTNLPHAGGWAFFAGGEFGRRLDLLRHLAQSSQLLLLVLGPQGSGKTTLLNELLTRAEHYWRACRVQAVADMDTTALFRQLALCTDLPTDCGEQALTLLLIEHAANLEHSSQIPVVMIDDAHLLSSSARAALVRLGRPGPQNPHPWHVLLFGQSGMEADIDEADRHTVQLGPLSPDQLGAYVHHRLSAAGFDQAVGPEETRRLYKASHGLPGQLEPLLGDLMRAPKAAPAPSSPPEPAPPTDDRPRPDRRRLYVRAGAAAAVVVVLGTLLAFQDRINALFQGSGESAGSTASDAPMAQAPVTLPAVPLAPLPLTPPDTADETHTPPSVASAPTDSMAKETTASPDEAPTPPAVTTPSAAPPPEEAPPSAPGATTPPAASEKTPVTVAAPPAPVQAREPEPQKTQASPPEAAPAPVAKPAPAPAPTAKPSPVQATTPSATAAKAKPASPSRAGHDWVLAQDPQHYTLQLLGSRDEATVRKAVKGGRLEENAHYYRIQYRGGDWYVLIYGSFADRTQAARAAQKLPAQPGAGKPWIRRVHAVQEEVRRGHK